MKTNHVRLFLKTTMFLMLTAGLPGVQSVAAASGVVAWGDDTYGQTNVPTGLTNVVAVAAGMFHSLALKSDGTVVGWGWDRDGQTDVPLGLTNVVAITAGVFHSLALKGDGTLVGWGTDENGALDIPSGLTNVMAINAGPYHNLALKGDGTIVVWGMWDGEVDVPADLTNAVAVAAANSHNLALRDDGTVDGWGWPWEQGHPSNLTNVMAIAAGDDQSLALKTNGTMINWDGSGQILSIPSDLTNVVAIACGGMHNLALKSDGTVGAWGNNDYGQINVPLGLTNVVGIAGGWSHSLAIVQAPPVITGPNDVTVTYGNDATFSVVVTGASAPVGYQWQKIVGGIPQPVGGDSSSYTEVKPSVADSGTKYDVIVSSGTWSATSRQATLTVTKTALTVTVDYQSRQYGYVNPPLTGTITGIQNNDPITATYSTSAQQYSPPGIYPIHATLVDPQNRLPNYDATIYDSVLKVWGTAITNQVPPIP